MRHRVLGTGLLIIIAAFAFLPSHAVAQCGFCSDEWTGQQWKHQFSSSGALFSCEQGQGCHGNWYADTCGTIHQTCNMGLSDLADELKDALNDSDPARALGLLRENRDRVALEPRKHRITLLLCDGTAFGRIAVEGSLLLLAVD